MDKSTKIEPEMTDAQRANWVVPPACCTGNCVLYHDCVISACKGCNWVDDVATGPE